MSDEDDEDDEAPEIPERRKPDPPRDPYPWLAGTGQKLRLWLLDGRAEKNGVPQDCAKNLRELDAEFEWVSSRTLPPPETKVRSIK